MDTKEKIKKLPHGPGVYIMKDARGEILYVGKATSLQKRVASYFTGASHKDETFVRQIADIEAISCSTPEQALILEAALIKERMPKYNVALRDNKGYPYVQVTWDDFPRVCIVRPKKQRHEGLLFGPYPHGQELKSALTLIRKIFPYRTCRTMPKRPCLFYHLQLCAAPCSNLVSQKEYQDIVKNLCDILRGERRALIASLKAQMEMHARSKEFEEAGRLRDKVLAVENLYAGKPPTHELLALKDLLGLPQLPRTIEAVDISILGSTDAVGSVVVFQDGAADKNNYRRFLIRTVEGVDDFAMIAEVVRRRYGRMVKEGRPAPQLIVVDGGRGQVSAAEKELQGLGISVPLIGIAKKNEEIWRPGADRPLVVARQSNALKLIQRLRDEAHRFAHAYGLSRRSMRVKQNRAKNLSSRAKKHTRGNEHD